MSKILTRMQAGILLQIELGLVPIFFHSLLQLDLNLIVSYFDFIMALAKVKSISLFIFLHKSSPIIPSSSCRFSS